MKKTLIALAAVAAATAASAQVTLSGNFALIAGDTMTDSSTSASMDDARLKFAASEDLGGGLKLSASSLIESNKGRNGNVVGNAWDMSLSGAFGTVTVKNYNAGATSLSAGISADTEMEHIAGGYKARNRMQYDLPEMVKGLGVTLKIDSTASNAADPAPAFSDFDTAKWDVSYGMGAFGLTLSGDTSDGYTDLTGEYDAGFAKFALWADKDGNREYTAVAPVTSAISVGVHVVDVEGGEGWGARATYALSKRTSLSFNYVDADVNAYAAANVGTNYRVKLNHNF